MVAQAEETIPEPLEETDLTIPLGAPANWHSLSKEEKKKIRRRLRRQARKANVKAGIQNVRRETSTLITKKTVSAIPLPDFRDRIVEILDLPAASDLDMQTRWYIGFSLPYLASIYPDPQRAAGAIVEALEKDGVPLKQVALFAGDILGVGPVPGTEPTTNEDEDPEEIDDREAGETEVDEDWGE
jgi:hypothetical protein